MTHEILSLDDINSESLLDRIETMHASQSAEIVGMVEKIIQQSEQANDYRSFTRALSLYAWANSHLRRYEVALISACEALRMCRMYGLRREEVRSISSIAAVFRFCGLKEESERLYQHARTCAEDIPEHRLYGVSINNHTMSRYDLGHTENLIEDLHAALAAIPEQSLNGLDHALILTNLSTITASQGRYDEAIDYIERALACARRTNNPNQMAATLHQYSSVYHRMGRYDEALKYIERARKFIEAGENSLNSINSSMLQANIYADQGLSERAIEMWEDAYSHALKGNMLHFAIAILQEIRAFYEANDDVDHVISTYRRLTEDISSYQRQHEDLRMTVLALVFSENRAQNQTRVLLSEQKQAILDRLSHEFRTPLTIIHSSSELIDDYGERMSPQKRHQHLHEIVRQVKSLTLILENISRLFNDEMPTRKNAVGGFSLNTMALLTLGHLERDGLPADRVQITSSPEVLTRPAPSALLEDILYQLLSNALRYSSDVVTLGAFIHEGAIVMTVTDTGIGIPEAEQQDVFMPLVRGSNQTHATGGGLGLAIVSKLVMQLGGVINLMSAVNQGTTVTVRIPL